MTKSSPLSPGRIVLLSVLALIICGALLLQCSWAQVVSVPFIDCLFIATSSVCVTGLMPVPLAHFSSAGQLIIMLLIQIGAVGLITLTVFFLSLFITMGLSTRLVAEEALELNIGQHPRTLAMFTIIFTLAVEFVGWVINFFLIYTYYPIPQALFYALFHSVASFCGAGITLLPFRVGVFSSVVTYALFSVTAVLVLIGGLGFIVWHEMVKSFAQFRQRKHFHFSLHTKLVLSTTTFLICMAALLFLLLHYTSGPLEHGLNPIFRALFDAICLRSAGFTTMCIPAAHSAVLFIIMLLSFVGSSPGSTGSGIKTTTYAIFTAAITSTLLRRSVVETHDRTIPNDQVFKAMAIVALGLTWVSSIAFLLLIVESSTNAFRLLFEAFSSFTNLGVSTSLTPVLSVWGKYVVMVSMLVGRIGSLTVLLALKKPRIIPQKLYYPEERVFMG